MSRVLVACEESQAVTIRLRAMGVEAFSCDLEPCSGGHPEWHLQADVLRVLDKDWWDMVLAFPPCTHICVSGAKHFVEKRKDGRQQAGIDFFMRFANAKCERVAIENPVGIMSSIWRKPDQIIQPWQFGDSFTKTTCLWLKGLPPLLPTNVVDDGGRITFKSGKSHPRWYAETFRLSSKDRARMRSRTFQGIADAMATQWGGLI